MYTLILSIMMVSILSESNSSTSEVVVSTIGSSTNDLFNCILSNSSLRKMYWIT